MAPAKAPHGQLLATGPVAQWRVGMSLLVYPTKENYKQITALAEKGQTGTFDALRPITVIPTWISGPEPGDKDSGEDKSIEITMQYRTTQGETGTILLTYWTPMSGRETSLPPDQRATIAEADQQSHDELPGHSVRSAAILGCFADVERNLIRTRTAEGRRRAQKRGQQMGRPPKLTSRAATMSARAQFRD
jgi:hypothetical protein